MQTLTEQDLRLVTSRTPQYVRDVMVNYPVFLAGGFIRATIAGEEVNDIDLFSRDCDLIKSLVAQLSMGAQAGGAKVHKSENAWTIIGHGRMPVQFITRWLYTDPNVLVNQFDFTIAQAAIWYDQAETKWVSVCSDRFYPDLAAKRLTYTYPNREEDGAGSILRAFKFVKKGYNIQAENIGAVIARLVGKMPINPQVTIAELGEQWMGACIAGLIREVDPLDIVDGLDVTVDPDTVTF